MVRRSDVIIQTIQSVSEGTCKSPTRKIDLAKSLRHSNMTDAGIVTKRVLTRPQRGNALSDLLAPSNMVAEVLKSAIPIGDRNKESDVYLVTVKNSKLVIKKSKNKFRTMCLAREYVIGEAALNNLRRLVPTFVYTLGAFVSPTSGAMFVAYEYISGHTLRETLANSQISFEEWLEIYCQILIALDLAQRECEFTHFDLHGDNVIIKKTISNYSVPIGPHAYRIANTAHAPVIIDFGYSTANVNGVTLGSNEHLQHGMLETMVSGSDQYKLLSACATAARNKSVRTRILELFNFYAENPYTHGGTTPDPKTANLTFCARVTSSSASSATPLDMLDWILENYKLTRICKEQRCMYAPLPLHPTVCEPNWTEMLEKAEARAVSANPVNVLLAKHDLHIARLMNAKRNQDVDDIIASIEKLSSPPNLFAHVSAIDVPWDEIRRIPTVYNLGDSVSGVSAIQTYMNRMKNFMCLLYIARETGQLIDECKQFEKTDQYVAYCTHYNAITRALRWHKR